MIVKSFELSKINLQENQFFLLYGTNEGHKKEVIDEKFKKFYTDNIYSYDESEILKDENIFLTSILSKSFFENKKLIIISRATDKINKLVEEILEKKIEDLVLVLNAAALEKKSKLRSFLKKKKKTICIPFYEDSSQTLS